MRLTPWRAIFDMPYSEGLGPKNIEDFGEQVLAIVSGQGGAAAAAAPPSKLSPPQPPRPFASAEAAGAHHNDSDDDGRGESGDRGWGGGWTSNVRSAGRVASWGLGERDSGGGGGGGGGATMATSIPVKPAGCEHSKPNLLNPHATSTGTPSPTAHAGEPGSGLHSFTFQLNLSALYGIGVVRKELCSPC